MSVLGREDDLQRSVRKRFMGQTGWSLMFSPAVELGELSPGHRVGLAGFEGHDGFVVLHYELVPPAAAEEIARLGGTRWHWRLTVEDDLGNSIARDGRGALDVESTQGSSRGTRDLGLVPAEATKLFLRFGPARAVSEAAQPEVEATLDLRRLELSLGA